MQASSPARAAAPPAAPTRPVADVETRAKLAFVPDIDEVAGAVARGTQQALDPMCQRAGRAFNGALGRLHRPWAAEAAQVRRVAHAISCAAGQAVLLGGAALAASACAGARQNARGQAERAHRWHCWVNAAATAGPPNASAMALARGQIKAARYQQRAYQASAVGAWAMAAGLLLATAPAAALGAWTGWAGAAAAVAAVGGMGTYGAMQASAALSRRQAAAAIGATDAMAPWLARGAGGRAVAMATPARLAVAALAIAAGAVGLLPSALAPVGLAAACALAAASAISGALTQKRARHAAIDEVVAPAAAQDEGEALVATTIALGADADVAIAWGGGVLACGLLLQFFALWTGVAAISAGSALLELGTAMRHHRVPPLLLGPFQRQVHAEGAAPAPSSTPLAQQAGAWAACLALHERAGAWPDVLGPPNAAGLTASERRLRLIDASLFATLPIASQRTLRLFVDRPWPTEPSARRAHLEALLADRDGANPAARAAPDGMCPPALERALIAQHREHAQEQWGQSWQALITHPAARARGVPA